MDQKFEIGTPLMRNFLPFFSFSFFPISESRRSTNLIKLTIFEMGVEEMTPIRNRDPLYTTVETITS